jgi:hypothetical protein
MKCDNGLTVFLRILFKQRQRWQLQLRATDRNLRDGTSTAENIESHDYPASHDPRNHIAWRLSLQKIGLIDCAA